MSNEIGIRAHFSYLSDGVLRDCVRRCLSNPGYKVGIFVTNDKEKEQILQEFKTGVFRFFSSRISCISTSRHEGAHVLFNNSSLIRIDKVKLEVRGIRLNEILVDKKISNGTIDTILYPLLINYNPLHMADYRQRLIQQEIDIIFRSENDVQQRLSCEQNIGFIDEDIIDSEENNELDEFINSFKINKHT